MLSAITVECDRICKLRCLSALAVNLLMQFLLLGVFLLFVNFHLFHMLNWISETVSALFRFSTWFSTIPLLVATLIYSILLAKSHLTVKKYYPSRFSWLMGTYVKNIIFLLMHVLMGLLMAWRYTSFLHIDYRHLMYECYSTQCLNPRYTFLLCAGVAASCYHFIKENLRHELEIDFPIIQLKKVAQIRALFYKTLYGSLLKMVLPTLGFSFAYWLLGAPINQSFAYVLDVEEDKSLDGLLDIGADLRLQFYTWILSSVIFSNMVLMQRVFSIFLATRKQFAIEQHPLLAAASSEITLVQALAMDSVPLVQNLAAMEFYRIGLPISVKQRQQVYALSVPGGHPTNWKQLSQQCVRLINAFTDELATSVKNISTVKSTPLNTTAIPTSPTKAAEKILLRQYNTTYGIRHMVRNQTMPAKTPQNGCVPIPTKKTLTALQRINEQFDHIARYFERTLRTAFYTLPGLFYMFGEADGAKTAYLLSNSQQIVWLTQGLGGIGAASLVEDRYGVVQMTMPEILKALLRLKLELDKLNNVNLNGKKLNRDLIALKGAVKRSLYRLCNAFGDYLPNLVDEPTNLRQLLNFVDYRDT